MQSISAPSSFDSIYASWNIVLCHPALSSYILDINSIASRLGLGFNNALFLMFDRWLTFVGLYIFPQYSIHSAEFAIQAVDSNRVIRERHSLWRGQQTHLPSIKCFEYIWHLLEATATFYIITFGLDRFQLQIGMQSTLLLLLLLSAAVWPSRESTLTI